MHKRPTRAEQNAANREAILAAAHAVFVRDGYHGTTVDAIAREAGFTIGALYSRFPGKADVFLALLERRVEQRASQFGALTGEARATVDRRGRSRPSGPTATGDPTDVPREAARRWAAVMRDDLPWTLLTIEFRVHAARNPELAVRYQALHQRALESLASNIATGLGRATDPVDPIVVDLARLALAASTGSALARAAEGADFTDQLFEELNLAIYDRWEATTARPSATDDRSPAAPRSRRTPRRTA